MRTDVSLRVEAMDVLIERFGEIDAERFIKIVKTDNFDYTQWRKNLWADKSIEEIHKMAAQYENQVK